MRHANGFNATESLHRYGLPSPRARMYVPRRSSHAGYYSQLIFNLIGAGFPGNPCSLPVFSVRLPSPSCPVQKAEAKWPPLWLALSPIFRCKEGGRVRTVPASSSSPPLPSSSPRPLSCTSASGLRSAWQTGRYEGCLCDSGSGTGAARTERSNIIMLPKKT